MTLHRVVLSIVLATGCGRGDAPPEQHAASQPAPTDARSADAARPANTLDIPFQLPPAQHVLPLPAAPGAYLFVTAQGALRAGTTPSFAAATEASSVDSLRQLIPPGPPSNGTGRYGTIGGGSPQGYGVGGGGGTYVMHSLTAVHADPSTAHVLVVADRGASLDTIVGLMKDSRDLYALAVVGDDGAQGALPLVLAAQAADGAQYQIFMSSVGAEVVDNRDGTTYTTPPGPNGMLDRAALDRHMADLFATPAGADARVGIHVGTRGLLSDLVGALDATTPGKHPVGITVRGHAAGMRARDSASVPQTRLGQLFTVGDMDKAIIRRYLKRNIQKIAYCYEKQLLAQPGLAGTVAAELVIESDGTVARSKADGVHPEVSRCIADVIYRIEFPKPRSGIVQVNLPFAFRPSGG